MTDSVKAGGLFSPEQCEQLSKKILDLFDENKDGQLDLFDVSQMLQDCYRAMNKSYNPTPTDIAAFTRKMDTNGQGRVDEKIIQNLCMKYLCTMVSNNNSQLKVEKPLQEINVKIQPTDNSNQEEILLQSSNQEKQTQEAPKVEQNQILIQPKQEKKPIQTVQKPAQPEIAKTAKSTEQPQQPIPEKKYTKQVQERLKVARRIFTMIDSDQSGYITETEVPQLLIETYKQMGMTIEPNKEDVDLWMEMADTDQDGKVSLIDYEDLIIRGLKQQGIQLE
ncbi:unnamed protein product (macronuclear) [Paramecium tetraurelia]|uniref:EF-hand domain-containing protein n=1 Tax=Paramecium tetraurelia TaxID=5888 RepID=A0BPZ4_PARTE|nr:uncharacterized protein GSPATT00005362001 [Paramecium tetraurelia]CAK60611.1 unnamed protein product [Paramecium tetraurelia]|eukprot:XP_001428009.1 hypothetical protein (macronuclear) [Paramecium tetraurelia strain d4-2]